MEYSGYNIVGDGTYGMKLIKTIGRGSLPLELRGVFTDSRMAQRAIDNTLSKKESSNGEVELST
jgi:hypothetical protein